jgi:hypothetical protein
MSVINVDFPVIEEGDEETDPEEPKEQKVDLKHIWRAFGLLWVVRVNMIALAYMFHNWISVAVLGYILHSLFIKSY